MHRLITRLPILTLVACLAACGGPPRATETAQRADDEEDDDRIVDEDYDDDDDDAGFVDSTLLRSASEPLELDEARAVPGTGVTMRPPVGSQPMPFGAGFLAMRHRVQFSVVVAEGDRAMLESIRTGGSPDAPEPDREEAITVSGQQGRIGRDRVESPSGTLERAWLLVHDGHRGLGIVATYEAERARSVRSGVAEVLRSVTWDSEAELDAAAALGIEVGDVQGLARANRSSANVVLIEPNGTYPPSPGQPVITVSPLPMQIPPEQQGAVCDQLVARFVPAPTNDITFEGEVEDGQLPGCERMATAETQDGERVVAYAALLFNQGMPILVTASAGADALATWRPRFASAARSVRARAQ